MRTGASIATVLLAWAIGADAGPKGAGLTITDALTGSFTSEPWIGSKTLNVHLQLHTNTSQHIVFDLATTYDAMSILAVAPWVNEGVGNQLILRRPDCGEWYSNNLVLELVVDDLAGAGGRVCVVPSTTEGVIAAQSCPPNHWVEASATGFASDGQPVCRVDGPNPVGQASWGGVKASFR